MRYIVAAIAVLLLVPTSARAACGVRSSRALYESPEVQIYKRAGQFIDACLRATGKQTEVGNEYDEGESSQNVDILGVWGRWVWRRLRYADAEDVSYTDMMYDLRTGDSVSPGDDTSAYGEVVGLPGAFVTSSSGGVSAFYTDGRTVKLSEDGTANGLAVAGSRVYWRTGEVAHTAVLDLPKGDKTRKGPVATAVGRCKPRKGARLVLLDSGLVVTQQGGKDYGCLTKKGKTRQIGKASGLVRRSATELAYLGNGMVRTFDVGDGSRDGWEGTAFAANATQLLVVAADGLHRPTDLLAAAPATEPALSGDYAYWMDGAGVPQLKNLAS